MKILGREPALWLALIQAVLLLVVAARVGLSVNQAGLIIALIVAVGGAVTAAATRPVAPAAFTAAFGALVALVGSFGLNVQPETLAGINSLIVAGLAMLTRGQVSPVGTIPGVVVSDTSEPF